MMTPALPDGVGANETMHRKAFALVEKLATSTGRAPLRWQLAITHRGIGFEALCSGNMAEAEKEFRKSLPIYLENC